MKKSYLFFSLLAMLLCSLSTEIAKAQWSDDASINNPICVVVNHQYDVVITRDGSGGAVIAWLDMRTSSTTLYAQRISSGGVPMWKTNGIVVYAPSWHLLTSLLSMSMAQGRYSGDRTASLFAWQRSIS